VIVDSSIAVAVCLGEPEADRYLRILESTDQLRMSAASYVESGAVLDRRRPGALDRFTSNLEISIVNVDLNQAEIARRAYQKFGKGSGHQAQLNFGDCFAYALTKASGELLLQKGSDFTKTDIECVII
jgi:ribonuclease VapC